MINEFLQQIKQYFIAEIVVLDGQKKVTAHGTAEQLSANMPCRSVVITALDANTSTVTIGGISVIGAAATRKGIPLAKGQSIALGVQNLNMLWIDSITDGDGVSFTVFA